METYHIHLNGIVQGVGFRPLIYHLAKDLALNGYVKNDNNGVNVFFNAPKRLANSFFQKIIEDAPERSSITFSNLSQIYDQTFAGFSIETELTDYDEKRVSMPPDMAICAHCLAELQDPLNRRYRYPFITCTQCGPRYSIINHLPYERQFTSMKSFLMCKNCKDEYSDMEDRRFFSQSNSCPDCGITLRLFQDNCTPLSNVTATVLKQVKLFLERGKIIAVKGIGGYVLICDASNPAAIQLLRKRKHRPSKPFAILYHNINRVKESFDLNEKEQALLESSEAPIVLLRPGRQVEGELALNDIAPGLNRVGVMVPYQPLFDLIVNDFEKPLIVTSANLSGSPIIYRDDDALQYLFDLADYVVSHNREIEVPQDDSVVQISTYSQEQIILRRSRGYAPSFLSYKSATSHCILSTGAFLKSSFTMLHSGNVFVSQYLGSGDSYESQLMYQHTMVHCLKMYAARPEIIVADMHPGYFSHQFARMLTESFGVKLKQVQHHEAHFAAILAEHNLLKEEQAVMGIIWDGTGLGRDGDIWGGEFFCYENHQMKRCYHLDYFPSIAGDKTASEPRIAALCATNHLMGVVETHLQKKFTAEEWNNYQSLVNHPILHTSSAGRLFDAVSCLLGCCDQQTYEGEAALYLQLLAEEYVAENGFVMDGSYIHEEPYNLPVSTTSALMLGVLQDIGKGREKNYIAAKFYYSMIHLIDLIAKKLHLRRLCFSGGVFQNALLVDWIKFKYTGQYDLYFHVHLSPNDENISFGQMVHQDHHI